MKEFPLLNKISGLIGKARLICDKGYFFKIDLESFDFELLNNPTLIKVAVNITELNDIIAERGHTFKRRYENWLNIGHLCYCAIHGDNVVGVLWIHNTERVNILFGYTEKVNDIRTEAWVIDAYIIEKHRGTGIYKYLWSKAMYESKMSGLKYIHAIIQDSNTKSFEVHYALGCSNNVYKIIYYCRLLWFNIRIIRKLPKAMDILKLKKNLTLNEAIRDLN